MTHKNFGQALAVDCGRIIFNSSLDKKWKHIAITVSIVAIKYGLLELVTVL